MGGSRSGEKGAGTTGKRGGGEEWERSVETPAARKALKEEASDRFHLPCSEVAEEEVVEEEVAEEGRRVAAAEHAAWHSRWGLVVDGVVWAALMLYLVVFHALSSIPAVGAHDMHLYREVHARFWMLPNLLASFLAGRAFAFSFSHFENFLHQLLNCCGRCYVGARGGPGERFSTWKISPEGGGVQGVHAEKLRSKRSHLQ